MNVCLWHITHIGLAAIDVRYREQSGHRCRRPFISLSSPVDVLAIGMLHAASGRGLAVPADFSVVGFDDIPFAAMTVPALTTVRMPVERMIKAAVEMAVDKKLRNAAGTPRGVRVFRPSVVVRRSTAKLERH